MTIEGVSQVRQSPNSQPLPRRDARGGEMTKEILKGFMMVLLIVVMALASAAVSNAQPANQSANQIVAAIPFEFSIDYKTMPAGTYLFQTVATAGDALLI